MICPGCGAQETIVARTFGPTELEPRLKIETGETMKTKPNPDYRPPDEGHLRHAER